MNNDEQFEQHLQRQPARKIPADWREEILSAANSAPKRSEGGLFASLFLQLKTENLKLKTIFWPHPRAWAGLAAVWILIFAANFSTRDDSPRISQKSSPLTPEMRMVLQQQKMMLAKLIEPNEPFVAEPPKSFPPRPRSERQNGLVIG